MLCSFKKTARYDPCNKILHVKFNLRVKYFNCMLFSWHEALSTKDTSICVLVGNIGRWTDYLNITCLFSCGGRLKRGKFLKLKMRMGWSTLVSINVTANTVRAAKKQWWLKNYGQMKCMNLRTNPVFMCHFKHKKRGGYFMQTCQCSSVMGKGKIIHSRLNLLDKLLE